MEYPILDLKKTGKRIKDLREERDMSVEEVTEFLGHISAQSVYKWQRGESLPTIDNLYALSKLFKTPIDDILIGNRGAVALKWCGTPFLCSPTPIDL